MILKERIIPGGWRFALVEDIDRNKRIEVWWNEGIVQVYSPSEKMYGLFMSLLRFA